MSSSGNGPSYRYVLAQNTGTTIHADAWGVIVQNPLSAPMVTTAFPVPGDMASNVLLDQFAKLSSAFELAQSKRNELAAADVKAQMEANEYFSHCT